MKEKDFTGYCGLYCEDCIRYKCRASHLAGELLNEVQDRHFSEYADIKKTHAKEFGNLDIFIDVLKAISKINCETPCGSGGDGCGGDCEFIACVKDKGLDGCWDCDDVEQCDKFDFLKPFHGDAPRKNLKKIKELGIEHWAKAREECYPWL